MNNATANLLNWNELTDTYTAEKKEELTGLYKGTVSAISQYEVVNGTIISANNRDVTVSIGYKSDGLISASEFKGSPELKAGDTVEVYIEEMENTQGQLVLSRKKAKVVRGWEKIEDALEHGEVLTGLVKRRTKGGLIVEVCDIETFLPGSQIDVKPVLDFDFFVDKTIDLVVIKISHANDNVVVSHRAIIEMKLEDQKVEIMKNLEEGQILEGYVKNITKFGAFIDLGGVDGLLHITDISWNRVAHPDQFFTIGQQVRVVVIGFNEDKKRISLGMKQLESHPWDSLPEDLQEGSIVEGKVTSITDYGLFIEVLPGIEGLVHISEISWSQYLRDIHRHYKVGDAVQAVILLLNRKNYKISLGIKQLSGDPWDKESFLSTYALDTKHQGTVRNLTRFGAFIELEPGIEGLLHISRISWSKRIAHPSDVLKVGEKIEVVILGIERENKRLSLSLKQSEENPWNTCEELFQIGTVHKGTIIKIGEDGNICIELSHGIEGQVTLAHALKEDGQEPVLGEELDFQVIRFLKADKRIILSHRVLFDSTVDLKNEGESELSKPKKPTSTNRIVKKTTTATPANSKVSYSRFEAFHDLKEKLKNKQLQDEQGSQDEDES